MRAKLHSLFSAHFDAHMQEVVRGAGAAFLLRSTGAVFSFLFNVLLARFLGADGSGIYYLAAGVVILATAIAQMGLDQTLLRFTAAHVAMEEWSAVKGMYRQSMGLALLSSSLCTALVMVGAPLIAERLFSDPNLITPLRWMALSIIPMTLATLYGEQP
jgi:stage V sporulation protein B